MAAFFGGPLAAGILVRRNYLNLGNRRHGEHALSLGISGFLLLILIIYLFPDTADDVFFYTLIPGIYTMGIYLLVEKFQGKQIRDHKAKSQGFYPCWKASLTGLLILGTAACISMGSYIYLNTPSFDTDIYNQGISEFTENENIALRIYTQLENENLEYVPELIEETGIPNWVRNVEIISNLNALEHLPEELRIQNQILLDYCQLRIKVYGLISRSIRERSSQYDDRIELIHLEIQQLMEEMESQGTEQLESGI